MLLQQPTPMMRQFLFDNLLQNRVHHIEALELLNLLPDQSIDAIITDLPYGTTACAWDEVIPFAPMWEGVKRVLKPRGVFVTTASQPFTSALVMSNPSWFRYEWIWDKGRGSNYQLANMMPMKSHENVLVFASESPNYFPQYWYSTPYKTGAGNRKKGVEGLGAKSSAAIFRPETRSDDGRRFPLSIISETRDEDKIHPTQKPVALYRYLVRTYTRPGDLVLDFCSGSGTTGEAARAEERRYILGEKQAHYVNVSRDRLRMPFERRHVVRENRVDDLPLFAAVGGD
jgi:site-specific DNA-methyltransferase (adenine-specific)